MTYLFDPDNWEWVITQNNFRFILEGFLVNLEIAIIAMVLSLIVGLGLALARLAPWKPVSIAAGTWIDVFRNLPLIFIILYLSLTIPGAWPDAYEDAIPGWFPEGLQSGRVLAAIIGLVLYNSAVLAEIMRAGILSLDRGQNEAARALGMSYRQSMRRVVLPQGLRRMVPATVSQLITLNKDTTLVSIVAIQEVMRHGRIVTGANFFGGVQAPVLQVFLLIGFMFIVVNLLLSRLSRRLEIRESKRTAVGRVKRVRGLEEQAI
ncbi:MAG TPA: amino acid ABC transporter permease [Solirubrobacteraceae bacterium]|nr:amino acid ABC transporter permease [Solirubrobacteraceae bacterium]